MAEGPGTSLGFQLGDEEVTVLRHVLSEVQAMLEPAGAGEDSTPEWARDLGLAGLNDAGSALPPSDPALARLLPDGSRDGVMLAGDFRRLTEGGLRAAKRAAIATAIAALDRAVDGRVSLSGEEAPALLRALTDVRLVMAERLGLATDDDANALHDWITRDLEQEAATGEVDESVVAAQWLARTYDFLTTLQQIMADLMLSDLPVEGDGSRIPPDLDV